MALQSSASGSNSEDALIPKDSREENAEREIKGDKFNWNTEWYPIAIASDTNKKVPTGVTVLGRDLVVWWDRNGKSWQVWEDKCPHRLAPLSDGRLNEKGELQCCYHGWCFAAGTGNCTRIPQAPVEGKPVWQSKRAYAAVYPTVTQEGIIWFWPDVRPEYKDIAERKRPPSIPALACPLFREGLMCRDMNYGYEQLIENLMDPAHAPFAHHGLLGNRNKAGPMDLKVEKFGKWGFIGVNRNMESAFTAPCIFTVDFNIPGKNGAKVSLLFICIPVSPGKSRLLAATDPNFSSWVLNMIPRWYIHIKQMLILDSDLFLLHTIEHKLDEPENKNWEIICYLPTKSDAYVMAFRRWLRNHAGGGPDWGGRYSGLPPSVNRRQLMDRYWTHVKICPHCTGALNFFQGAETFLQMMSVGSAAVLGVAALKPIPQLRNWSILLGGGAVASTLASRWLSHFIKKTYHYHDYNHALVK